MDLPTRTKIKEINTFAVFYSFFFFKKKKKKLYLAGLEPLGPIKDLPSPWASLLRAADALKARLIGQLRMGNLFAQYFG